MTTSDTTRASPQPALGDGAPTETPGARDNADAKRIPAPSGLNDPKNIQKLQIAVIAMGIVLIVGIGVVIARIVYLATRSATPTVTTASPSAAPSTAITSTAAAKARLALPDGAQIQNMSLSGNRLAIHFTAPTGAGIRIIDTTSGAILGDIQITPEPPTR